MIVIVSKQYGNWCVETGCCLEVQYGPMNEVIYKETLIRPHTFSALIIFVFCDEDGTVRSQNLCVTFADADNLPPELRDATPIEKLSFDERVRFAATAMFHLEVF